MMKLLFYLSTISLVVLALYLVKKRNESPRTPPRTPTPPTTPPHRPPISTALISTILSFSHHCAIAAIARGATSAAQGVKAGDAKRSLQQRVGDTRASFGALLGSVPPLSAASLLVSIGGLTGAAASVIVVAKYSDPHLAGNAPGLARRVQGAVWGVTSESLASVDVHNRVQAAAVSSWATVAPDVQLTTILTAADLRRLLHQTLPSLVDALGGYAALLTACNLPPEDPSDARFDDAGADVDDEDVQVHLLLNEVRDVLESPASTTLAADLANVAVQRFVDALQVKDEGEAVAHLLPRIHAVTLRVLDGQLLSALDLDDRLADYATSILSASPTFTPVTDDVPAAVERLD